MPSEGSRYSLPHVDLRYVVADEGLDAVVDHDFYEGVPPKPFTGRYATGGPLSSFFLDASTVPPGTGIRRGSQWTDTLPVDFGHLAEATDGIAGTDFDRETGALTVYRWDGQRADVELPSGQLQDLISTADGGGWVLVYEEPDAVATLFRYDADGGVVDAWPLAGDGYNAELASLGGRRAAVAWSPRQGRVALRIVEARR